MTNPNLNWRNPLVDKTQKPEPRANEAQLRLLQVVEVLSGNEVFGMRLTDVADALKISAPTALRDLRTLEAGRWAQQLDDNKWRLAAKPIQILSNFQAGLQNATEKLREVQQRYTCLPN